MPAAVPLAEFDPPVARAVAAVLRRSGVQAEVAGEDGPELTVLVPPAQRDEALAAMAAGMDDIRAEVARSAQPPAPGRAEPAEAGAAADDEESGPPLVFERLRRLGFLPVLLVPLLVVTLAQTRLPAAYAVALVIGGAAAVVAWRDGRRRRS